MYRPPLCPLPFAAVVALTLQGCKDANRPLSPTPMLSVTIAEPAPLVPRIIAPPATDPAIDWVPTLNPEFNHHFVWLDPSRPSNGKLFVFLPGVGPQAPRPRVYQLVQQEAARLGYHVIGLMWQNNVGPGPACTGSPDPGCFENFRLEMIDGVDRSAGVDVSRANSIDNRLTKLLLYLDAQYPAEGWSRFLHKGAPKWSRIAVGGHSGAANQAALIAKIRHVDRVVLLSGPAGTEAEAAGWVPIGETPAAKYFELVHGRDHFAPIIFANVSALGLERFGDPVAPELSEPPYGGTHILVTDLEPLGGYATPNPHTSTAVDTWTPRGPDGTPLLREAWRYLIGSARSDRDDDNDDVGGSVRLAP